MTNKIEFYVFHERVSQVKLWDLGGIDCVEAKQTEKAKQQTNCAALASSTESVTQLGLVLSGFLTLATSCGRAAVLRLCEEMRSLLMDRLIVSLSQSFVR